jgi:hypothetical protein
MLLDIAATPLSSRTDDETRILSVPIDLRRSGRATKMLIEGTDPFATAKPDARLIKLLISARRFNATLLDSDGVPFAALAKREGVSPSISRRSSASAISPGHHPSYPRRTPAARSDPGQAAGALPSSADLPRATHGVRLRLTG